MYNELRQIKKGKAAGNDKIPPNLIRDGAEDILSPLCYLANMSLHQSLYPTAEKCGKIISMFKYDSRDSFDKYRQVLSASFFLKCWNVWFISKSNAYFESKSLLNSNQYGFRKGRCTTH